MSLSCFEHNTGFEKFEVLQCQQQLRLQTWILIAAMLCTCCGIGTIALTGLLKFTAAMLCSCELAKAPQMMELLCERPHLAHDVMTAMVTGSLPEDIDMPQHL